MKQAGDSATPDFFGLSAATPLQPARPAPLPVNYKALGDNYRERERVARKVRRLVDKLARMPDREKAAILEALGAAANTDTTGDAAAGAPARSDTVAVLFARNDSIYKTLAGCDVWDIDRDARAWPGGAPIVAHPPCRSWGSLSYFAKPAPGEKDLAPWAVDQVRRWGGVLEHPRASKLWKAKGLPPPDGTIDEFGGWTLEIRQSWFGHRAAKETLLYIVGCTNPPPLPVRAGRATHVIAQCRPRRGDGTRMRKGDPGWRPEVSVPEREHTPADLAAWLVELARRCKPAAGD